MKKVIYSAFALFALAACSKEVDNTQPFTGKEQMKTVIIAQMPTTKSLVEIEGAVGHYNWEENETIAVFNGTEALQFTVENRTDGTFSYSGSASVDNLSYAVSPEDAISNAAATGYELTLKENYTGYKPNVSNAIMVAGVPTEEGGYKKFTFNHAAALMRFTFENVPAGTSKLVFSTADKKINGTYDITGIANPELTQADASGTTSTTLELATATTDENSTLVFYVPIPTGDYTDFTVKLFRGSEEVVTKTMSKATKLFTAAKGDIINTPVITLNVTLPATYSRITSTDDLSDGDYLIVCESANVALDGSLNADDIVQVSNTISISHSNGVIMSSATLDASAFTITTVSSNNNTYYTIKSKSGLYIGHSGTKNTLNATDNADDAFQNTIQFSDNNASITMGDYTLKYNSATDQTRFRYYKSGQTEVQLYRKNSASSKPQLSVPQGLSVDAGTKTVSWHKVTGATSYTLTVNGQNSSVENPASGNTVSKVVDIEAGYYDVSVVAVTTNEGILDSAPATLTGAKFGTPKLGDITFSNTVTVTENSIEVSWTSVAHATKYHCSINPEHAVAQDVTDTSVKFEGLTTGETYAITVYAIDENGLYNNSEPATKSGIKAEKPSYIATLTVSSINEYKTMGTGSYGDYKDTDVPITIDELDLIAKNICANAKDGTKKLAASQFIQMKSGSGYIYNTSGSVSSVKIWVLPSTASGLVVKSGTSANPSQVLDNPTPTSENFTLKDNNNQNVSTSLSVYEFASTSGFISIAPSATLWVYKVEIVYE